MVKQYFLLFLVFTMTSFANVNSPYGPRIAGNTSGDVVAVWSRFNNTSYVVQQSTLSIGGSWSTPVQVSSNNYNALLPDLAMNDEGDIVFVWQSNVDSMYQVFSATGTFGDPPNPPSILATTPGTYPRVALDATGNSIAVWQGSPVSTYALETAFCLASSFTCGVMSHLDPTQQLVIPVIAIHPTSGDALIVWQYFSNLTFSIQAVAIPYGSFWGTPITLSSSSQSATNCVVVYSSSGEALVAWQQSGDGNNGLQVISYSSGTWGTSTTFNISGSNLITPTLAINASGDAILAAECSSPTDKTSSIVVAQRTSGTWGDFTTLSNTTTAKRPQATMSQTGDSTLAAVIWENNTDSTHSTIYASTLASGSSWSTPSIVSTPDINNSNPVIWMNNDGSTAIALWNTLTDYSIQINTSTYTASSSTWSSPSTLDE